ncbi:glutathione S-transferase family protein [Burkholderia humptydooensis]|uniref:Glutathione S-transferase family protein n=2 Tax=Burkholderia humptydooensis TaxID=430531 RepID=A0A7U4SRT1_9BURK|nr:MULTISPECIES: glutathione binding-like protein [Burkholderia]AJY41483.1 glutathione S-transferase [Burkholderia sp. 2002721687]ALX42083.1 glutathione S-transferase [Burkholderia humptydooensis]EIP88766.1 glutathione S-transferase, putative [Burkholderia humptydooensis MSMB43]QPS42727.1 glutathione S-transferase family protein [Burkholderia humptydooensis]
MKLYYSPGACSLAIRIALTEAGLPFESVKVDLSKHRIASDGSDYYAVSPRGYVPLVELDDGTRHTEAAALLQRVGDLAGAGALIPAHGTASRYEVIEWLTFVSSELGKTYSPWLFRADTADSTRQQCLDKLDRRLKEVDVHLATRDYLTGGFTVADAYLFAVANWSNLLRIPLAPYPHLVAFMERVAARPKVKEALAAEGLGR